MSNPSPTLCRGQKMDRRHPLQTLNGRLPLKLGSDRPQTLPKRVSDDPRHFIFRWNFVRYFCKVSRSVYPRGWLWLAWNLAKTRFRRSPTFHLLTLKPKFVLDLCSIIWSYDRMIIRSCHRIVVWSYDRLIIWPYDHIWSYDRSIILLYDHVIIWSYDRMVICSYLRMASQCYLGGATGGDQSLKKRDGMN